MSVALDFYAYWNGSQVADVLQAVVGIVGTDGYRTGMSFLAIAGFLTVMTVAAVRYRGGDVIQWFAATVFFFFVVFVPKVNVNVHDVRAMTVKTVANVPMGPAFVACATSQIGKWTAELFETAFSDVDAARFTKFGAVFPERVVAALQTTGPVLPETRALLNPFIEHCIAPEILDSDAKLTALMQSTNLLSTIKTSGWLNPARFFLREDGTPLYCTDAVSVIETQLKTVEIPAQERKLLVRLADGSATDAVFETALRKAIPEAETLLLGISRSMSESLGHALLMTEIPKGLADYAGTSAAGSGAAAFAASIELSKAQAHLSTEISFRTMGELVKVYLPKLRNLLEAVLIAAFPLVFLVLVGLGSQGGAVARMYAVLFIWISLWAPLAAVMNHLIVHMDAEPMNRLVAEYGGTTLLAADAVRVAGTTSQAMAGYLMIFIPIIAYAIAKGSEMGAVSLASSVLSPANSAAQAQSSSAAMGNVTTGANAQGSTTLGAVTTGKTDYSNVFASPDTSRTTTPYGTVTRDFSTGDVTALQVVRSDLGVESSSAFTNTLSNQNMSSASSTVASGATVASGSQQSFSTGSSTSAARSTDTGTSSVVAQSGQTTYSSGSTYAESIDNRSSSGFGQSGRVDESLGLRTSGSVRAHGSIVDTTSISNTPLTGQPNQSVSAPEVTLEGNEASDVLISVPGSTPSVFNLAANSSNNGVSKRQGSQVAQLMQGDAGLAVSTTVGHDNSASTTQLTSSGNSWNQNSGFNRSDTESSQDAFQTAARAQTSSSDNASTTDTQSFNRQEQTSSGMNTSTGSSESRNRSGSVSTRTASDPMVRDRVIDLYGSPEEALRGLSTAEGRRALGRDLGYRSSAEADALPHLSEVKTDNGNSTFRAAETLAAADKRNAAVEHASAVHAVEAKGAAQAAAFSAPAAAQRGNEHDIQRDAVALSAGASKVVSASFQDELGFKTLMQVGVLAGLAYDTPGERFTSLMTQANNNPELRQHLIDIGSSSETNATAILKALETPSPDAQQ
ncbi:conjugal transfer protein TraG N-terminal domain-containing protein [Sutterella megalosphaeroides]|uniref:TraG N-terminal Proteobacteria domain-containing protein n=1 Tax=Sutterella megalosphaeroides TaxID=2494234 RepID=A0A2Z6IE50_9BURK|nr:conjugal transfer protein TraG N-terminal domain-containing protein [Sutterella megalosphaeroides]BBF23488.1 hypothetical protein SUTMEG_13790 [Sutterella megalosphaeroides]